MKKKKPINNKPRDESGRKETDDKECASDRGVRGRRTLCDIDREEERRRGGGQGASA
jgi:hypothetical protein